MVQAMVGSSYLHFQTPIVIQTTTPHMPPIRLWAVCADAKDDLYVMNEEEQWHQVEDRDQVIIPALHHRVRHLHNVHNTRKEVVS